MSATVYNGIDLSAYLLTQSVDQSTGYDPSNTDQLYTKTKIQIQTILNANYLPSNIGFGENPGDVAARIKHYLTAPRRPFSFTAGGGVLISLPNGLDDANGPKPTVFSIQEITPLTFVVSWGVEVCLTECGSQPPPYLSLRWSESVTHDRNWVATRSRKGILILSSRTGASGDDFRGVCAPDLPLGFRRETADYGHSPDGLTWNFNYIDKQIAGKLPPFPALEMKGGQIESIPLRGGMRKGEIMLSLTGPPGVSTRDLMTAGVRVAMGRIWASNPLTFQFNGGGGVAAVASALAGKKVMMGGSIKEDLGDDRNGVDLRFEWNMVAAGSRATGSTGGSLLGGAIGGALGGLLGGLGGAIGGVLLGGGAFNNNAPPTEQGKNPAGVPMFADWVGQPIAGSDPSWPCAPPTRGMTDSLALVAAILRDPCLNETSLANSAGVNELTGQTTDGASATISELQAGPDDTNTLYGDDQGLHKLEDNPGTWDTYHLKSVYTKDPGVIVEGTTVPGSKSVQIQTQSETWQLRLEWAFVRVGGKPTPLPFESFQDDNFVLVSPGTVLSLENLDVAGDGVSIRYAAAGISYFGCLDPSIAKMQYPIPPFLQEEVMRTVRLATTDNVLSTTDSSGDDSELTGDPPVGP